MFGGRRCGAGGCDGGGCCCCCTPLAFLLVVRREARSGSSFDVNRPQASPLPPGRTAYLSMEHMWLPIHPGPFSPSMIQAPHHNSNTLWHRRSSDPLATILTGVLLGLAVFRPVTVCVLVTASWPRQEKQQKQGRDGSESVSYVVCPNQLCNRPSIYRRREEKEVDVAGPSVSGDAPVCVCMSSLTRH